VEELQKIDRRGLRLQCRSKPQGGQGDQGGQWWTWAVWLEGSPEVLDQVRSVRYALHPTFPNPVQTVTDRSSNFRLEAQGWGEFAIGATVTMDDGANIPLERWLTLNAPGGEGPEAAAQARPRLFISYSGLDRSLVAPLMERLKSLGIEVTSSDTIPALESMARSVGEAVQKADVVAVVTHGELRGWAEEEVSFAAERGKPIIPIVVGGATAPRALAGFAAVPLGSEADLDAVSDAVAARVNDAFFPDEK